MNCVRKHLSAHQGRAAGRAVRAGARGDAADQRRARRRTRASSPAAPRCPTRAPAPTRWRILAALRHRRFRRRAGRPGAAAPSRRPSPATRCFAGHEVHMIATPQQSLEAAAALARARGLDAHILSDEIEGESREVGKVHAALARARWRASGQPFAQALRDPLSGGETTVTVRQARARGAAAAPASSCSAARSRCRASAGVLGAGGRHRRHRRHRGQRRRHRHARHAGARARRWA